MFSIIVSLNFPATCSRLIPDLPCPPAAWVWVLASWTGGPAAAPKWSEGTGPGRPWPPAPCTPGGRDTSSDAESTSFLRAVLISWSARWSEAWTEVPSTGCEEALPTDKKNSFSLFSVKRKQQQHPTPRKQKKHLSSRPSPLKEQGDDAGTLIPAGGKVAKTQDKETGTTNFGQTHLTGARTLHHTACPQPLRQRKEGFISPHWDSSRPHTSWPGKNTFIESSEMKPEVTCCADTEATCEEDVIVPGKGKKEWARTMLGGASKEGR